MQNYQSKATDLREEFCLQLNIKMNDEKMPNESSPLQMQMNETTNEVSTRLFNLF